MLQVTIDHCVSELGEAYPGASVAHDGAATLVRLPSLRLPEGCDPERTDVLILLDPGQDKPRILVRDKAKTPGGVEPRNVNPETIGGDAWFSFSFNLAWNEDRHTAVQFVEGALRRFVKDE